MHVLEVAGVACGSLLAIGGVAKGAVGAVRWGVEMRRLLTELVRHVAHLIRKQDELEERVEVLERRAS